MMSKFHIKSFIILLTTLISTLCFAELKPDEILIITNTNEPQSLKLAEQYAKLRKIPLENIIALKTSTEFSINRETYEKEVAFPLKQELISGIAKKSVKVLVLMYGMPFKINELATLPNREELTKQITQSSNDFQIEIKEQILKLQSVEKIVFEKNSIFANLEEINLVNLAQKIFELHTLLRSTNEADKNSKALIDVENMAIKILGKKLYLNQNNKQNDKYRSEIVSLEKKLLLTPDDIKNIDSSKLLDIVSTNKELNGLVGAFNSLKLLADRLIGNETSASLDSELSLVWLFPGGYPISSRLPNPFYFEQSQGLINYPFLMVSRIDGPNPEIVSKNINNTIIAEKKFFRDSNFLIDSRGFGFDRKDEFGIWDRELTTLAKKSFGSNISVEFDGNPDLAIDVKNISLYLGWYQLRNFENSYSFVPGAIGLHIASEEAINIHNKEEKGWCKNLLEKGVVATVGAVEEPYLDSFPNPNYFFSLITSGNFQLIDSYYLSTKYISWRQILFGDPLYNPFKNHKIEIDFKAPESPSSKIKTADKF
jgi:uncharacterized protein (TIGR03790 family)